LFFALLIAYPWEVMTIGTLLYLASLPFGLVSYRNYERKAAASSAQQATAAAPPAPALPAEPPSTAPSVHDPRGGSDRPSRLN
jgi:CDP-diacylglycerol---serine O-phosphatidyltransferase